MKSSLTNVVIGAMEVLLAVGMIVICVIPCALVFGALIFWAASFFIF